MVVPERILSVVGLLVVLTLGPAVELVLGGLSAGFAATVAAQGAATVRAQEDTPALAATTHEQPGVQNALAVVDEGRPQGFLHHDTLQGRLPQETPHLHLSVPPVVPRRNHQHRPIAKSALFRLKSGSRPFDGRDGIRYDNTAMKRRLGPPCFPFERGAGTP